MVNEFITCPNCRNLFTEEQMKEHNKCPYCYKGTTENPQDLKTADKNITEQTEFMADEIMQNKIQPSGTQFDNTYNQTPPTGQQYGNGYNQVPPTGQQYGNGYNQAPPTGQQYGNGYNQAPPAGQQYGNGYNQAPPTGQQYGNGYNQAPPTGQQYGNGYNQVPPTGQQYGNPQNPMQAQLMGSNLFQSKYITLIFALANVALLFMHWFTIPFFSGANNFLSMFGNSSITPNFSIFDVTKYLGVVANGYGDTLLTVFSAILSAVPIAILILYGLFVFLKISNNRIHKVFGILGHIVSSIFSIAIFLFVTYGNYYTSSNYGSAYLSGNIVDLSIFFYLFIVMSIAGLIMTIKEKV